MTLYHESTIMCDGEFCGKSITGSTDIEVLSGARCSGWSLTGTGDYCWLCSIRHKLTARQCEVEYIFWLVLKREDGSYVIQQESRFINSLLPIEDTKTRYIGARSSELRIVDPERWSRTPRTVDMFFVASFHYSCELPPRELIETLNNPYLRIYV